MKKVIKVISHIEELPERNQGPSAEKQKQHNLCLPLQTQALITKLLHHKELCGYSKGVLPSLNSENILSYILNTTMDWNAMTLGVSASSDNTKKGPRNAFAGLSIT